MKLLIIEDESRAFAALKEQLEEMMPNAEIEGPIESIEEAIEYFETQEMPNLVFMDIHLADGSAFAIFDSVEITCPIIFTTAYDQYALKAFDVNCIDYLLKPIETSKLHRALDKFQNFAKNDINHEQILRLIESIRGEHKYKKSLMVPNGEKHELIECKDIAFVYIDTQVIKLITMDNKIYFMNDTLEDIQRQLDPQQFYRANRQQIINRDVIKEISTWIGSKVLVSLKIETNEEVTISKGRAAEFKKWLIK